MEKHARSLGATLRTLGCGAILAAISMSIVACSADGSEVLLPAKFLANSLQCDTDNLFLFGGLRGEHRKGDPSLFSQEAVVLRVRRDGSEPRQVSVGPGFFVASSRPQGSSTIFAVLASWSPKDGENGELVWSRDLAGSWAKVEGAPQGLIGVAFVSETAGFVWSSSVVYRTEDGGKSWDEIPSPGPIIRGNPMPSLDRTGALWVPINHGPAWAKGNVLARFTASSAAEKVLSNSSVRIDAIDASQLGSLWLVGQREGQQAPELSRISLGESEHRIVHIADFDPGLPEFLGVAANNIVVAIADMSGSAPSDRMLRSRNRGASWENLPLPEPRISAYCMTGAATTWVVGTSGRVYLPE